jgi:hypothetical protein
MVFRLILESFLAVRRGMGVDSDQSVLDHGKHERGESKQLEADQRHDSLTHGRNEFEDVDHANTNAADVPVWKSSRLTTQRQVLADGEAWERSFAGNFNG